MKLHLRTLLATLVLAFTAISCTQQAPAPSTAGSAAPDTIQFGLKNNMGSGLPVLHPALMLIENGRVSAFRAGIPDAGDALTAVRAGNAVEDAPERREEIQAALDKLLDLESMSLDAITGSSHKVIVLFFPDASFGECVECTELFASLDAGGEIGGFSIRKVVIEDR